MKTATYSIKGMMPMMMHSDVTVNPFAPITKQLKQFTSKRKRTEDDLEEIARLEFLAGLYYNDEYGICVPGFNLFAAIMEGGKLFKLGTAIKRAVIVTDDYVSLQYEGPKKPDALFKDKQFVDIRSVVVNGKRINRCRPVFRDWSLKFNLAIDETAIEMEDVDKCLKTAGRLVGLGDYRPRFGRFEVLQ